MAKRINISLTDAEYEKLVELYKAFIMDHDWTQNKPPSLTGYVEGVVLVALQITGSSGEE